MTTYKKGTILENAQIYASVFLSTENLSRRKDTVLSQSSLYRDLTASLANDGDLQTYYIHCAHTDYGHNMAWFQVDLGIKHNIHSVKIYYRKEGK